MINPAYSTWKFKLQARDQTASVEAVQVTATTALADAAAAQADASAGISDAAAAQGDASDALEGVASLSATTASITEQTEALFNTGGQVAMPYVQVIPYSAGLSIIWVCTTSGRTLYYRINGGSWTVFSSGTISLSPGDTCEAYATAPGLTDSAIAEYAA